ncbi:hypothetical protein [Mycobacterium paragordonae]|uniref:Uncharacterized protein n=1 Tax=Mycobacterium paragordonae TaxID=1389713 RepID=A0ABQ1CGA1_9MYCO|nr:hypothetical protein [Mycobacterium paragordonae]GFG83245.1 hypothetical protein MPRG_65210 [Mycobacterium paragordonae]
MSTRGRIARITAMIAALTATAVCAAPVSAAGVLDDLDPRDTSGVPITEYRLSFNNGAGFLGSVLTPDVSIPAALSYVMFCVFMVAVWIGFTTLNLLPRTDWLSPLVHTIDAISNRLYTQLGVPFITMMISGLLMLTTAVYVLRNKGNRAWHHIAMTLVCVIVGASITFPVAEAAKMLGIGAQAATATGQAVAGANAQTAQQNPTGVLIDEWVRKPVQRWTFGGQDMDSLNCGAAWTAAIRAHKPDEIKDAPLSCPGGSTGQAMHDAAMHPQDSLVDSGLTTVFGVLLGWVLVRIVLKLIGVSVAALIHAGMIKIGLIGVGTETGQRFLVRNAVDAPVAALTFFAGLLAIYVGADIAKILAQVVPSSRQGMLLMIIMIVGALIGVKRASQSWNRRLRDSATAAVTGTAAGGGSPLIRNQISGGRTLALATAARYTLRQGRKAAAAAAVPELAAPTAVASKVRAAAQRARGTGPGVATQAASLGSLNGANTAPAVAKQTAGPPSPAAASSAAAPAVAAPPNVITQNVTTAHYARAAASHYRAQRGARYGPPPAAAARRAGQPGVPAGAANPPSAAMAAASSGDSGNPQPAGSAIRRPSTAASATPRTVRPSRPADHHSGAAARRTGGDAESARQVARGYFRGQGKK